MAAPLLDMHIKYVIEYGFELIRKDPDKHLKDIFGDAKLDPHAAIYGNRLIEQVKTWFVKTDIPVILGFDLTEAKLPSVTVNLQSSGVAQAFMGDYGAGTAFTPLQAQERQVLVQKFAPVAAERAEDGSYIAITLPPDMPLTDKELIIPGLKFRDPKNREYAISQNDNGDTLILEDSDKAPLSEIDLTALEVVSPVMTARTHRQATVFQDQVMIGVHGHGQRSEGLWLYYIVMWCLLKLRPVLQATFGIDLSMPVASDFAKAQEYGGENIWQRFISLSAQTVWSWEGARQEDILGLILTVHNGRNE